MEPKAEPKRSEPYDVPTSGAFWMHDDRMADDEFAASGCVSVSSAAPLEWICSCLPYPHRVQQEQEGYMQGN